MARRSPSSPADTSRRRLGPRSRWRAHYAARALWPRWTPHYAAVRVAAPNFGAQLLSRPAVAASSPELQFEVIDGDGQVRRLDFAWPGHRIAVEYDSLDWHGSPDALRDDRRRTAALMDVGWIVIAIVFEDVRHRGGEMVARINARLRHARAA